jgi:N6-L-threonylcarbamoyladenine synthase
LIVLQVKPLNRNLKENYFLGLDTSAYTTSLALVNQNENLVFEQKIPLSVNNNQLGLRQSEAVFAHLKNMAKLCQPELPQGLSEKLTAVASAVKPRNLEESYMPVFKVSEAFGLFVAQIMGLQYFSASHQEGHLIAGLWSANLGAGRYLALHLSGGTTEILSVIEQSPGQLKIDRLGGTTDLNAGQFIDRIGKLLNLSFPAGPELEKLARGAQKDIPRLTEAVKNSSVSFSGPASQAERFYSSGCCRENLARAVECCIADSMSGAVTNLFKSDSAYDGVLAVGGVTANRFIRERLTRKVTGIPIYFAAPRYSADNAAGLAVIAARRWQHLDMH